MKYKVTGSNRDTGARMTLEFEANSKGEAERKAQQAGMNVNHAALVDGGEDGPMETSARGMKRSTGMHPILKLLILIAIVALAYYFIWPLVRGTTAN